MKLIQKLKIEGMIQELGRSLGLGESAEFKAEEISDALGFDLNVLQGLSSEATVIVTRNMSSQRRYLLGLAMARDAIDYVDPDLGIKAATLLIESSDSESSVRSAELVIVLQRLFQLSKMSA